MIRGLGRAPLAALVAALAAAAPAAQGSQRAPHIFVTQLAWAPGRNLALAAGKNLNESPRLSILRGRRLVTFGPPDVFGIIWSPQGDLIAFDANTEGLEVLRPDGTGRRLLRRDAVTMESWSPDGRRLLFDSGDGYLWVVGRDGRGARRVSLINDDFSSHAVWSPDGRRIAFQACLGDPDVCDSQQVDLFVVGADGKGRRRITRKSMGDQCRLSWAPARDIVYGNDAHATVVAGPDGKPRRTIRGFECVVWSPDGTRLLGLVGGAPALADPRRGAPRRVVRFHDPVIVAAPAAPPVWSRDGKQIAFDRVRGSFDDPLSRVYVVDVRSGRVRTVP